MTDFLRLNFLVASEGELSIELEDIHQGLIDGAGLILLLLIVLRCDMALEVEEDGAPQVSIGGIKSGESISPKAVLNLEIQAQDDIGLAELSLARWRYHAHCRRGATSRTW